MPRNFSGEPYDILSDGSILAGSGFHLQTDAKGRRPSPITRCNNKQGPTSNLQSTYAEDTFVSGTAINIVGK
jgi:hypothetical protein